MVASSKGKGLLWTIVSVAMMTVPGRGAPAASDSEGAVLPVLFGSNIPGPDDATEIHYRPSDASKRTLSAACVPAFGGGGVGTQCWVPDQGFDEGERATMWMTANWEGPRGAAIDGKKTEVVFTADASSHGGASGHDQRRSSPPPPASSASASSKRAPEAGADAVSCMVGPGDPFATVHRPGESPVSPIFGVPVRVPAGVEAWTCVVSAARRALIDARRAPGAKPGLSPDVPIEDMRSYASLGPHVPPRVYRMDGTEVRYGKPLVAGEDYVVVDEVAGDRFMWPLVREGHEVRVGVPSDATLRAAAARAKAHAGDGDAAGDGEAAAERVDERVPAPKEVTVRTLALEPRLYMIENLLSPEECDAIIKLAEKNMTTSAVYGASPGRHNTELSQRNSETATVVREDDPIAARIDRRFQWLTRMPEEEVTYESIQVTSYKPGQYFRLHHDFLYEGDEPATSFGVNRFATIVLYLNDDFEGGGTWFPRINGTAAPEMEEERRDATCPEDANLVVKPKKGSAALFYDIVPGGSPIGDENTMHSGCAVTRGRKFIINKWVRTRVHHNMEAWAAQYEASHEKFPVQLDRTGEGEDHDEAGEYADPEEDDDEEAEASYQRGLALAKKVFRRADKNRDRKISFREFTPIHRKLKAEGITQDSAKKLEVFADIDRDRSKTLSFAEVRDYAVGFIYEEIDGPAGGSGSGSGDGTARARRAGRPSSADGGDAAAAAEGDDGFVFEGEEDDDLNPDKA